MPVPKSYKLASGFNIPTIGLGTYDLPPSNTTAIVEAALEVGYRHLDTAVLYGNEAEVAQGAMNFLGRHPDVSREDIFYTTKLWNSQFGYEKAKRAIRECVECIGGLGYIDLLLMHSPIGGKQVRRGTWKAMQEAVDDGLVRSIGVSSYGQRHLEDLFEWSELKHAPAVNQIEISPWIMRQQLADYCKSKGIVVEAYSPLTHGYKLDDPDLLKVAEETGKNPGQVLLRWSLQHGYVPLPKTKTVSRLQLNLDVFDWELSPEHMKLLDHPEAYEPTDWECTDTP
ncbi:aldo-keto reductase superfamily protein KNAG_0D01370 [Huiozyma naganishii CBS 8797]|uniref:NADP-dependent oxidoreductase domain-containing protein n=1 Tax=Huiozyma naganishii (strain ATCC MYA-139 / BCRC 22969 / CBS 8797 / KCTC 17520 / NBRC 10181 / NCYC 3082 / Yp74L-3) TaxID=1071383 RepID=J7S5K4_HUIN7|nr:hypothetical protein KNAG_0D01370 [Kazachstania naganishii CBS 8797]CCK69889.1 hypothetical protein KNAG_0D01370 [Kazachstania naganishii CBS 8797]